MSLPADARRQALAESLGEAIRERRLELGLSQRLVAVSVGTRREIVCRAESGRQAMNVDTLIRYAEALGTTPSALLARAEQLAEAADPTPAWIVAAR